MPLCLFVRLYVGQYMLLFLFSSSVRISIIKVIVCVYSSVRLLSLCMSVRTSVFQSLDAFSCLSVRLSVTRFHNVSMFVCLHGHIPAVARNRMGVEACFMAGILCFAVSSIGVRYLGMPCKRSAKVPIPGGNLRLVVIWRSYLRWSGAGVVGEG